MQTTSEQFRRRFLAAVFTLVVLGRHTPSVRSLRAFRGIASTWRPNRGPALSRQRSASMSIVDESDKRICTQHASRGVV
jgi:hypothetical protein